MKDLSYKDYFTKELVPHEVALKNNIKFAVIEIIREENKVSEKSFNLYDQIINFVNENFNDDCFYLVNELYNKNKRVNFIAEYLYDTEFKNKKILEDNSTGGIDGTTTGNQCSAMPTTLSTETPNSGTGDLIEATADTSVVKKNDKIIINKKPTRKKPKYNKLMDFEEFTKQKLKQQHGK